MKQPEEYNRLSIDELLEDAYFQESMRHPTPQSASFWAGFVQQYPDKKAWLEDATNLIQRLHFKQPADIPAVEKRMWEGIAARLATEPAVLAKMPARRNWLRLTAAAACAILIAGAAAWLLRPAANITFSTKYGEVRHITLPDSSKVTLNANSTLAYPRAWDNQREREVWIKGEAYFEVTHQYTAQKERTRFVVHASQLNVEVTGTAFNVNNRSEQTQVVLSSGRVRINFTDQQRADIVMSPGEKVAYSSKQGRIIREQIKPVLYTSWKDGQLEFEDWPVSRLATFMQDQYGYTVQFESQATAQRLVSGSVSCENEAVLLQSLATALHLNIDKRNGTLIISEKQ